MTQGASPASTSRESLLTGERETFFQLEELVVDYVETRHGSNDYGVPCKFAPATQLALAR